MYLRNKELKIPERKFIIKHTIEALNIYFSNNTDKIYQLPVAELENLKIKVPLKLIAIELPDWGAKAGVEGKILVPEECLTKKNADWSEVDWFLAIFLLLESCHERTWELQKFNIKSYSIRLRKWDTRAWDYAWVNRIGIFLLLWSDKNIELNNIGRNYDLKMSHDVDAITKTFQLRLKQGIFNLFNSVRKFKSLKDLKVNLKKNLYFFIGNTELNHIWHTLSIEKEYGLISTFNLYSKIPLRGPKSWLLDPSYTLKSLKKLEISKLILDHGCDVGMHGSIKSAYQPKAFLAEKNNLEKELNLRVRTHRQHWLSLYWQKTFNIYDLGGLHTDSTVMFNDISGFRNSACLLWKPWNFEKQQNHLFSECPTVVMDSQIYDYAPSVEHGFARALKIITEVKSVGGQGQILWHPHTLSTDFGWDEGFRLICSKMAN
jgi:hypothetical protein